MQEKIIFPQGTFLSEEKTTLVSATSASHWTVDPASGGQQFGSLVDWALSGSPF